nr:flagellar hook-associated protein FlgL [candidate division Zixibacteria bacterium]
MRVTNQMISDQVVYNLSRSLSQYMKLQSRMSSGRRLEKPSDDPVGTQKDLRYRKTLTEIAQYQRNISSGLSLLSGYDNTLGDLKNIVSSANEVAVSLANDTYDATARNAAANEIKELIDQMLSLANNQVDGRYVFSGYRTDVQTIRASASGFTYQGDFGNFQIEIEPGSKVGINLIGADFLLNELSILGEDADLEVGVDAATLLADLHLGEGVDLTTGTNPGQISITDNNSGITVLADISAATTLDDVVTAINTQLAAGGITNLAVDYGLEGNNLRWVTADNGLISAQTPLSNLNSGNGIDMLNGGFIVHNADYSTNVEVDLSSAANIGDVISTINTALTAAGVNATAAINGSGTGIDITDNTGGTLGLSISEVNGSATTATDLGLLGDIDPVLNGKDLNPVLDFSVTEAGSGQTTAADLGLEGDFSINFSGSSLQPTVNLNTPLSLIKNGLGLDLGVIKVSQGDRVVNLNLGDSSLSTIGDLIDVFNNSGLDIEASINADQTGIQVRSTSTTTSLKIEEIDDGQTAHNLGIFGSPDILGSMTILENALRNDDRDVVAQIIGNLDKGMQEMSNNRASIGSKVIRLENTNSRLTDLDLNYTNLLSEVEDADLTELVTDLAMQENNYQAALIAAAKIIQPTLLDFLS